MSFFNFTYGLLKKLKYKRDTLSYRTNYSFVPLKYFTVWTNISLSKQVEQKSYLKQIIINLNIIPSLSTVHTVTSSAPNTTIRPPPTIFTHFYTFLHISRLFLHISSHIVCHFYAISMHFYKFIGYFYTFLRHFYAISTRLCDLKNVQLFKILCLQIS